MAEVNLESRSQAKARMIEASPASRPDPALASFEHRFATVSGLRLHYVTGGKEDGNVAVLLAGFPESWFAWRKVMPLLGQSYKVIALDLPGQGDSDRPQAGYDTKTIATTVHGLIEQLGTTRYFLAGHDVGAGVAYPYAALFGDEVRRPRSSGRRNSGDHPARCRVDGPRAGMVDLALCLSCHPGSSGTADYRA
jgi:microsomal epoxide hydrolase